MFIWRIAGDEGLSLSQAAGVLGAPAICNLPTHYRFACVLQHGYSHGGGGCGGGESFNFKREAGVKY